MEYKVSIGGIEYGMEDIESVTIESPLFDTLSAGNACSAELEVSFWPTSEVPRMAKIIPFARENDSDDWTQIGAFYTDQRFTSSGGKMKIVAYDSMLKSEAVWTPSDDLNFPMTMIDAVTEIASLIGVDLDARTVLNDGYTTEDSDGNTVYHYYIDYPANDYTLRDVLRFIAAAHMGNWIITADDKLLLVPLFSSMPDETNLLVTEDGDAITFGGVRITV